MPRRLTNLLLLGTVIGLAATGLLGWLVPEPPAELMYGAHRVLGAALIGLAILKIPIARGSLRRRLAPERLDRSVFLGAVAGAALVVSSAVGLLWTAGVISFDALWGYSPLNLHVFIGGGLLLPFLWHLLRRWEGFPRREHVASRRSALRFVALGAVSLVSWQTVEAVAAALHVPGARRVSGSKHAGSFSGNAFPYTSWLFDETPAIDPATWRLRVISGGRTLGTFGYEDLARLPQREVTAVLDCTSGWWSEQVWSGPSLGELLARAGEPQTAIATVVSVTGHRWSFPVEELRSALVALRVGDEPLAPGHGYPARLVAPGRRGFQWVKWVDRIELS